MKKKKKKTAYRFFSSSFHYPEKKSLSMILQTPKYRNVKVNPKKCTLNSQYPTTSVLMYYIFFSFVSRGLKTISETMYACRKLISADCFLKWSDTGTGLILGNISTEWAPGNISLIFLNDFVLDTENRHALHKYAAVESVYNTIKLQYGEDKLDNSEILCPKQLMDWSESNRLCCNYRKCKELVIRKKENKNRNLMLSI